MFLREGISKVGIRVCTWEVERMVLDGGIVRANGLVFDITRKRLSDEAAEKTRWKEKVSFGGFVWTEGDKRE
jgi:hypothetical protein